MRNIFALLGLVLISTINQGCTTAVVAGGGAAATAAHDRRTVGTFIEDQNIEIKANAEIRKDEALYKASHINVTSYNNIVLLSGETPTADYRARAEAAVQRVEKVRKVHNELIIASPSSLGTRSSDTWITTKVKTSLLKIKGFENFDPTRVKVVTENGTVFLMGLLTRAEADAVVDVARQVKGVQRVVKLFEYVG